MGSEAIWLLGILLAAIGHLWIVYAAYQESPLWGAACFLIPFADLIFVATHFSETKIALVLWVGGLIIVGTTGYGFSPFTGGNRHRVATVQPEREGVNAQLEITTATEPPKAPAEAPVRGPVLSPDGTFVVDSGPNGFVEKYTAASTLWQAYFAQRLREPAPAKPFVRFRVVDMKTITLLDGQTKATIAEFSLTNNFTFDEAAVAAIAARRETALALVGTLVERLAGANAPVISIVNALGTLGVDAKAALPLMAQLCRQKSLEQRRAIMKAVAQIDPTAPEAFAVWALGLTCNEPDLSSMAATSLAKADPSVAVTALTPLLKEAHASLQIGTAMALGTLREKAKPALLELAKTLQNDRNVIEVRKAAAVALKGIGAAESPDALALVGAIAQTEFPGFLKNTATQILENAGAAAIPAWSSMALDRKCRTRSDAIQMLGKLGAGREEVVPTLLAILDESPSTSRTAAIKALGECGASAAAALPALTKIANSRAPEKAEAAEAVRKIKAESAAADAVKAKPAGSQPIKTFVLKDGRRIKAKSMVDGGDAYILKDAEGGGMITVPKTEVEQILSVKE